MQSTSWETLGWKKCKLESRLQGEISITSDMQMIPPLWHKAILFWGAPKSLQMVTAAMKLKRHLLVGRKVRTSLDHILKSRDITFVNKGPSSQGYGFSSGYVWMWEFDYKESWALKNWCFWTVVLEKTLESPLDSKEIQLVHSKGNQSWMFIGRTDAEAGTPIFWPPDVKNWLI